MRRFFVRRALITYSLLIILGIGLLIYYVTKPEPIQIHVSEALSPRVEIIGKSVDDRLMEAYVFGTGEKHLIFVGGIHGGYEWNSVLLAYKVIDYLKANPNQVAENLTITIIPSANPDGVFKVVGKEGKFTALEVPENLVSGTGRFNANDVDLNRNFACNWQATSTWRTNIVSAGTEAFSEPEVKSLRDYILKDKPELVIFWHSQSNAIYASACNDGILPDTLNYMDIYSNVSGYPTVKTFDSYAITGAADDWLASINIPAFSVELKTHESIEWEKNLAGIEAILNSFTNNI